MAVSHFENLLRSRTLENVDNAIAAFEETLTTPNPRFYPTLKITDQHEVVVE